MNEKIFLIDDDATMLRLLQTYLQFEGFHVILPGKDKNLEQTIETIRRDMPAIVLLDVYMHQFNGFDLLRAIRQDKQINDIGVIVTSGADFSDRCLEEGADFFIMKPYMPDDLIQSIHKVLAEKAGTNRE
jgi:DNA-binding response OmpR family regulator